jgi:hypothetical protein
MHKKYDDLCICHECPIRSKCQFNIRNAIVELLKVRTLITLLFSITFCVSFARGYIEEWQTSVPLLVSLLTMILTFYFRKGKDE